MSFAFVFPGQGSQSVGMLAPLAESYSSIEATFEEASEALGYDLWDLCQNDPDSKLSQTEFTQPALLTAGVAVWRVWQENGGKTPSVMAGHSLGEYTALTCANSIKFSDAVSLVQDRGRYMQTAVSEGAGGMAAIIGLEDEKVIEICENFTASAAEGEVIQAVNFNAPGQVVIAGTKQAITDSVDSFKEAGAKRALPLPISIPAHSQLMSPASEKLSQRIADIDIVLPEVPVIHNCNVSISKTADELRQSLVTQLDSPVLWVKTVESMVQDHNIETLAESGPGKVLCGMVKRIANSVVSTSLDNADSIEQALAAK